MGKRDALVSTGVSTENVHPTKVATPAVSNPVSTVLPLVATQVATEKPLLKSELQDQVATQVATENAVTTPVTTEKHRSSRELNIEVAEGETEDQAIARAAMSPVVGAMLTRSAFSIAPFDHVDPSEHAREIAHQVQRAQDNDMDGVVSMLMSQAHALDAIFNSLASRAAQHVGKNGPALDLYLRQALRAQSQCRTTLEAVAEIKNPRPVAFIKQQNNAAGPQQVNNGAAPIAGNASETTHRKT